MKYFLSLISVLVRLTDKYKIEYKRDFDVKLNETLSYTKYNYLTHIGI